MNKLHILFLFICFSLHSFSQEGDTLKPKLEPVRIGGEILAGEVIGIGCSVIGFAVAARIADPSSTYLLPHIYPSEAVLGYYLGNALGAATGAYIISRICGQKGSFGLALAGAGIGTLVSAGLSYIVDGDISLDFLFIPAITATIAVTLTRQHRK